jgi:CRP-like cAMP-binding protein
MLSTVERVLALKAAPLFSSTPEPVLAELAGILHELELPAGSLVFTKGELGTCMYIIAAGRVRVFDGPRTLIELGFGEVVGEMAILDTEPRSADVEAMEDLLLLRLDQGPFYELMEDRFEIARGIILTLSRRLRHLLTGMS